MKYLYEKVKEVVDEHIKVIESKLPKFLEAYYIYDSVSFEAFNYGNSDIDFIAVIKRKATKKDIDILKKIHDDMQRKFHKTILDGLYVLKDDIESLSNGEITCLRFNEGVLYISLKTIEWGVFGISRLYFTFMERDIISKVGAGEYALRTVPQRWHKIIKEAMRLRKNNKKSYYNSVFKRRRDALGYIDFIIQESNKLFEKNR